MPLNRLTSSIKSISSVDSAGSKHRTKNPSQVLLERHEELLKSLEVVAAAAAAAAKLNIIPTRILSLLAAPVQLEHLQ